MLARDEQLQAGAVILAPGYQIYNAALSEYGIGRYPNVVTSLQFERLLSASGPTLGHVQRQSDGEIPQRIAFLQCIGSRDQSHDYCSAVCCMYATKEAMMAKEHHPDLDIHVFLMDMRAFSKGYWSYFERAQKRYGIQYIRCRISSVHEDPRDHNLWLEYQDENGQRWNESFDLVVLSVGMEISESVRQLGDRLGIELDEYGFCHTVQFNPVETSRPGIFAVGPFREPKDIPESIVEASGAAASAAVKISTQRFTRTILPEFPPERDVSAEEARIGVFVCHCGSNIAGYLDVPTVCEYAAGLPGVVHAESNVYTCSQDSIRHITETVGEYHLNRVVVASCTPLTHAPLFQDSIREAGLNPYLFEMANIRNQCSWVHSADREAATCKAKDLVRMAVARAALLEMQPTFQVPVENSALVVGGGAAGMTAALFLADGGFPVVLVEKEAELGGNLRFIHTAAGQLNGVAGKDPQKTLRSLVQRVGENERISIHLNSRIAASSGFMGNFTSTILHADGRKDEIHHGATILATGAQEYRGPEYGYGEHAQVVTQQGLEALIAGDSVAVGRLKSAAMIQCVGPAETFCSRICCSVALKNALALKALNPEAEIVIFYRDIRTYGFKERLYTAARQQGVLFVRYDLERRPEVRFHTPVESGAKEPEQVEIRAWDTALRRPFVLTPDLVVLSMPVVPNDDAHQLAALFKAQVDADGFFQEAHVKLRPVDFATEGVFMAGLAHYPKLLDESMIQAQAAAGRAARVLSRESLTAGGREAVVHPAKCTRCLTCVRICPFSVPKIQADVSGVGNILGAAIIEAAVCQGCGLCAAECPARAIQLMHYTDAQMVAKVRALVAPEQGFIPLENVFVESGKP